MITEKDLLKLKTEIDSARDEVTRLKGRLQSLMETLSETWGAKTLKEAEKKLKEIDAEVTELNTQIKQQTEELETQYSELLNQ